MSNPELGMGTEPMIVVEPVYGECWPDGFTTIGWRARMGDRVLVSRGFKSQVTDWLHEHHPAAVWKER